LYVVPAPLLSRLLLSRNAGMRGAYGGGADARRRLRAAAPNARVRHRVPHRRAYCHAMSAAIIPVIELISAVIQIFIWMLIVSAILSWLTAFGVVNRYNRVVATIGDTLYRLTDPILRPIRSILPNLGGVDVSPIVAILILTFIDREIGVLAVGLLY
jgi:YggT family protein